MTLAWCGLPRIHLSEFPLQVAFCFSYELGYSRVQRLQTGSFHAVLLLMMHHGSISTILSDTSIAR